MNAQAASLGLNGFSLSPSRFAPAVTESLANTATGRSEQKERAQSLDEQVAALDVSDMGRLVAGHDAALNDLMERHAERLFHYLLRSLENEEDAADLAQEAFTRVYQHRISYHPAQKFSTWLYAIASNLVRNRYRWRGRHPQVALDALTEATGADHCPLLTHTGGTPSQNMMDTELAETVRRAVAQLPEDLRLPLILAEYEDRTHAEIAQILHCTAKAVEMRVYRARKQLQQCLAATRASL